MKRNYFDYTGGREEGKRGQGRLKHKENIQKRVEVSDYKVYQETKKFSVNAREQWEIKMQRNIIRCGA